MRRLVMSIALAAGCGGGEAGPDGGGGGGGTSLRFFGAGGTFGDRIRFPIDDPGTGAPGPPLDVGAGDFTIELWLRAAAADNPNTIGCGPGIGWTGSNIFVDRDRHSQAPVFGAGIAAGAVAFAVGTADGFHTLCGDLAVADDAWHHVALQRRADGRMWIYVDGQVDEMFDGPVGDASYPDDGTPLDVCPAGPCDYSDPYLVLGAEKHGYPDISFDGRIDELRVSSALRYSAPFGPRLSPFNADSATVGLYHFDEGDGAVVLDASDATPAVDGELVIGDDDGPVFDGDTPF
jgi:hypothetical protein